MPNYKKDFRKEVLFLWAGNHHWAHFARKASVFAPPYGRTAPLKSFTLHPKLHSSRGFLDSGKLVFVILGLTGDPEK